MCIWYRISTNKSVKYLIFGVSPRRIGRDSQSCLRVPTSPPLSSTASPLHLFTARLSSSSPLHARVRRTAASARPLSRVFPLLPLSRRRAHFRFRSLRCLLLRAGSRARRVISRRRGASGPARAVSCVRYSHRCTSHFRSHHSRSRHSCSSGRLPQRVARVPSSDRPHTRCVAYHCHFRWQTVRFDLV